MLSDGPIVSASTCKRLIDAARCAVGAQMPCSLAANRGQDYRSLPAEACGPGFLAELAASGLISAAAKATGIAARSGEDIMLARTARLEGAPASRGVLNLHHDRHKRDGRLATFMINLATVNDGGETFFPAAGVGEHDPVARDLRQAFERGERFVMPTADLATACERRLHAWREGATGEMGVGVSALAGTALWWDSVGGHAQDGAWHSPCLVTGVAAEKFTITFFKAPPPVWSSMLLN